MQGYSYNMDGSGPSIWAQSLPHPGNGGYPNPPDLRQPSPMPPSANSPPGLSQQDWPTLGVNTPAPQTGGAFRNTPPITAREQASLSAPGTSQATTLSSDRPSSTGTVPLDTFAPVYVPLWLRQIAAAAPSRIIRHHSAPVQDPHEFAKAIFPKTLYDTIREEKMRAERLVTSSVNLNLDRLEKLDNTTIEARYASKLLSLQMKEFQARTLDLEASTLYNAEIRTVEPDDEAQPGSYSLFKLEAPEIKEGYPMLEVNDLVFLRHLQYNEIGVSWNGIVLLAEVRALKRARGLVLIRCNALHGIIPKDRPELFIVGFEPQGEG